MVQVAEDVVQTRDILTQYTLGNPASSVNDLFLPNFLPGRCPVLLVIILSCRVF